jgi:hypothetical protein
MSNETIVMIGAGIAAVAFLLVLGYNAIHGISGSLRNARVGEVYNFEYEQPLHGEPSRILAKVVEPVHYLSDDTRKRLDQVSRYRRNDPQFKRTSHLVTCEMPNGEIRQFYAERTKNVRRCLLSNRFFRNAVAAML